MVTEAPVPKMPLLHCNDTVPYIDNYCYSPITNLCVSGCDFQAADKICDYVEGGTVEIRPSGDGSIMKSKLNTLSSSSPFWINLKGDDVQKRFIWRSDGTYLDPRLSDPLWFPAGSVNDMVRKKEK